MTTSQLDQLLNERAGNDQEIIDVDEPLVKLVIFRLGEQHFAFAGANITEVLPGEEAVHYLPGMPASVEGVMNVRGDIESVIRLDDLLQLITESEAELIELPAEQIHALPPHLLARRTFPALQAVAWYQQRLVSIIDARVLQGLAHPWLASVTPDVSQAE